MNKLKEGCLVRIKDSVPSGEILDASTVKLLKMKEEVDKARANVYLVRKRPGGSMAYPWEIYHPLGIPLQDKMMNYYSETDLEVVDE